MKRDTSVVLFIIALICLMPLMYFAYFYYIFYSIVNQYTHIKSVYLQDKTYSLYKKNECEEQCYYIAVCLGNDVDEGCPVNVLLMDYAEFMFKADKIYNVSVRGDTLLISSSKDIKELWGFRVEAKDDNQVLYKANYDRGLYVGDYFILVKYNYSLTNDLIRKLRDAGGYGKK